MKKIALAVALVLAFAGPALALVSGPYYVGLNTVTHTCSVVTHMSAGMKMMGKYSSKARAERAMHRMTECKG